jgi:hypothetical protein
MMKPCQTSSRESTQERERKRTKGNDQSPGKANSPKEVGHKEAREPLSIKTSTKNLHQSLEAYQLKKGELNPIKLQA